MGGLASAFMGFLWILNGAWGLKFALPFTVHMREVFGNNICAKIATTLRAFVALMWYGINSWFCAMALDLILCFVSQTWAGWLTPWGRMFILFLMFTGLQYLVVYRGYTGTRWIMIVGSPILVVIIVAAILWVYQAEGTLGPVFTDPQYTSGGSSGTACGFRRPGYGLYSCAMVQYV